jgi:type 1 glutamine amidotransferase
VNRRSPASCCPHDYQPGACKLEDGRLKYLEIHSDRRFDSEGAVADERKKFLRDDLRVAPRNSRSVRYADRGSSSKVISSAEDEKIVVARNKIRQIEAPKALRAAALLLFACSLTGGALGADPCVVYQGSAGPGQGKHIVLVSGDEEYRSEEALPQLGKILADRHGFKCTVLFAIGKDGTIDPSRSDNIPGLENLRSADLMIIATRFRDLPDDQMKEIVDFVESGRPIIGMRTATHAFNVKSKTYADYSWNSKTWPGGFGRQVLGETWVNHHGHHGKQSTRGIIAPESRDHPIVRGINDGDIWGPTDVYEAHPSADCTPLVFGQVLQGMKPTDEPVTGTKNDPMMPIAWYKTYAPANGKKVRVFTTTMGAATDLESEGLRRLLVNAAYWAVGLEDKIPPKSDVSLVGEFHPLPFGFGGFKKGVKPGDQ